MMRFLADENFHNDILKGLRKRIPNLDIIRVQDTEMYMSDDVSLLAWAAQEGRILITHDIKTMPRHVYQRVREGLAMPGVIELADDVGIGDAIEELTIMILTGFPADFENQIHYICAKS
jgi:hypothetical protein